MGLYGCHVFPHLMDWTMSSSRLDPERRQLLAGATGQVLEIGFGTGLNIPYYPESVTSLTAVEPANLLPAKVEQRMADARMRIHLVRLSAEKLPFDDRQFDSAVSTWTLCTIADPVAALREVRRVLKPGGRLLFLEHGRSDAPDTAVWQDRLNPLQRIVGCGCSINRRIDELVKAAGLQIERLDRYQMEGVPRIWGEMFRGSALA